MATAVISDSLLQWAKSESGLDEKLNQLVELYAEALDCQRCILYCREPDLRRATTTHSWSTGHFARRRAYSSGASWPFACKDQPAYERKSSTGSACSPSAARRETNYSLSRST